MIRALGVLSVLTLAACGGAGPGASTADGVAGLALARGTCPSPDPVRDGPLVDAIRTGDAAPIRAALAANPGDPRATAALAIVTRQGTPDPSEAACFAPYL